MPTPNLPPDCLIVIFGASGDLTKRKLIPALYDLYTQKLMPERFAVVGISRTPMSDEAFRERLETHARTFAFDFNDERWRDFSARIHYHAGDSTVSESFVDIKKRLREISSHYELGENVLFYLSLAPRLYDPTIMNIGMHDMVTEGKAWCSLNRDKRPWQRIIVEKPFGHDVTSASHLNRVLGRVFEDESVFRIDHYLGKETVQNLMVLRFANSVFEPIWNRNYISDVQITAAETVGVEGRGGYYDSPDGGAMRDMIQSHLLQLMALVAMEPPVSMGARDIRAETYKALAAARKYRPQEVDTYAVRGQYVSGMVDGKHQPAYRDEEGVDPNSQNDTYAAMQVMVDSWRWRDVPFYLRSGKRLKAKTTEIVINFKPTPHALFAQDETRGMPMPRSANQIIVNVQPNEGVRMRFLGKVPGVGMRIEPVMMDFDQIKRFGKTPSEAYATLLLDAMNGDQTNFKQRDEIEQAWQIVQPVLDVWKDAGDDQLAFYASGTWGPREADELLTRHGHHWHVPG